MNRLSGIILGILIFFLQGSCIASEYHPETLKSRFILTSDPKVSSVADLPLNEAWWSRPYEYLWASQFVGENLRVLDAACGIPYPFKWYLGQTCDEAWVCDIDPSILSERSVAESVYRAFGLEAYLMFTHNPSHYSDVHLFQSSITSLPESLPTFDRIFCISTLEEVREKDRWIALKEFARILAPDGLIILTVDYPMVTPEKLFIMAKAVGLVPAGEVEWGVPPHQALTSMNLWVYVCVLKHAP